MTDEGERMRDEGERTRDEGGRMTSQGPPCGHRERSARGDLVAHVNRTLRDCFVAAPLLAMTTVRIAAGALLAMMTARIAAGTPLAMTTARTAAGHLCTRAHCD